MKKILLPLAFILAILAFLFSTRAYKKIVYPLNYMSYINACSKEYNIDPLLLLSMIKVESNFRTNAVSRKGACGLMQIMPSTGEWIAGILKISDYNKDDLMNPEISIKMGAWYISYLLKSFDGKLHLALAAYNAGIGNVTGWKDEGIWSGELEEYGDIPYAETSKYIKKVDKAYSNYLNLYPDLEKITLN